jgi:hypothetical protein
MFMVETVTLVFEVVVMWQGCPHETSYKHVWECALLPNFSREVSPRRAVCRLAKETVDSIYNGVDVSSKDPLACLSEIDR